jgi:hypothetical protein
VPEKSHWRKACAAVPDDVINRIAGEVERRLSIRAAASSQVPATGSVLSAQRCRDRGSPVAISPQIKSTFIGESGRTVSADTAPLLRRRKRGGRVTTPEHVTERGRNSSTPQRLTPKRSNEQWF